MAAGWIKLHRGLLESEVISDDWLCRLWVVVLLKANSRPGIFKGIKIEPGSFAFSYRVLSEFLGVSRGKLKRGLKKLENSGQISLKAGRTFSTVSVCNWSVYQARKEEGRDANGSTDGSTSGATDGTTNGSRTRTKETKNNRTKEKKNNRTKEKKDVDFSKIDFPEGLDSPELRTEYDRWFAHRKEIRKPVTTSQFQEVLKKFELCSASDIRKAISNGIAGGWQGIFPPEENGVKNANGIQATRPGRYQSPETDSDLKKFFGG